MLRPVKYDKIGHINMKKEGREILSEVGLSEAREFLTQLVPEAGEILKKHFASGNFTQRSKGGVDFTTQADEEVDVFLREHIKQQFPQTQFLTEETTPKDYFELIKAENLWVIDPLDGTTNFSRKRPHFAISVALVDKGISRLGVVYLPMQNELYEASEDSKALLNGREMKVSNTNSLQTAWIESGLPWDMDKRHEFAKDWIPKMIQDVRAFTMSGSIVFDMAKMAQGEVDGVVFCGIKPWDQAATGLLIQKAGGIITTAEGKSWNVFEKDIVASNGFIHNQLLELLANND